ncbi:AAA family ATPase [Rhizobium ruizarguesonis]|uniref:AAA family ATPase n=1 Tax=Rhizobium ruizarguesonis TaxID=2081791 RepID=UPI0018D592B8|nr:MoxR family ATPase [Rhizobium ruizarguesonis]
MRAKPFIASEEMILAVNAALYLRRPLLLTGKPGTGKSTLISKVADELRLGPVLRWPINSRSTVRTGIYEYDAVGRLQAPGGTGAATRIEDYLVLGPLGASLAARGRPVALLVDEIDKSDLDFANDLLNVIEEGEYEIPELKRMGPGTIPVSAPFGQVVEITGGLLQADHFPFVVMTSNAEREFPAPFLRRCVRLDVGPPDRDELEKIVKSQLTDFREVLPEKEVNTVIEKFLHARATGDVSTDQLLNAVFLTVALKKGVGRTFSDLELEELRTNLLRPIT